LSANLADRVKNSSAERRRQAVPAACSQAVEHSALTDPIALSILSRLRAGDEIDDLARLRLDRLVDAWDEEAWKEVDNAHTGEFSVHTARFNKARAANALVYALEHESRSQDSWLTAAEAVYEVLVCLDDDQKGDTLTQKIAKILSSEQPR
jgi:hypothetical protein